MRKFILISIVFCFMACKQDQVIQPMEGNFKLDGIGNEEAWSSVDWQPMNHVWLGDQPTSDDFEGRYKVLWKNDGLYVLSEIKDDILMDQYIDPLEKYWDDDCLEIFVDVDASGGNHQFNNNAFAYHISLDNRVADMGKDSLPHLYNHIRSRRTTSNNLSVWEVYMPMYGEDFLHGQSNRAVELKEGQQIGFAIAYCDNDESKERENFIGSMPIPGEDKNRAWIDANLFTKYHLVSSSN